MPAAMKLNIDNFDRHLPLPAIKGRLFAATPTRNKPRAMPTNEWCTTLMNLAMAEGMRLVVPSSLYGDKAPLPRAGFAAPIIVPDRDFSFADLKSTLPHDEIREVLLALLDGQDLLLLSASKTSSYFIPAAIAALASKEYLIKLLWPAPSHGYTLTDTQVAYVAGLHDAVALTPLIEELQRTASAPWLGAVDAPMKSLTTEQLGRLDKDIDWTRDQLRAFASELFHELTPELVDITNFLGECEQHPDADITIGGLASIGYRLCEVFKATAEIGLDALKTVESESGDIPDYQRESRLAQLRGSHGVIAEQLACLYDSMISFISCDVRVLAGHPEIANTKALLKTIKLIEQQLDVVFCRIEEIRWAAQSINHEEAVPLMPKKDRDWKAMKAMLAECVAGCRSTQAESVRWSGKPMSHPKHDEDGNVVTITHTVPLITEAMGATNPGVSPEFFFSGKGYSATAVVLTVSGEWIIKAQSTARPAIQAHVSDGIRRLRQQLQDSGKLKLVDGKLIFQEDCSFKSASTAASVVCGSAKNGKSKAWKLADGMSFKAWDLAQAVQPPGDTTS